eukprot:gb/GECG01010065.1/.p1 GENE.gb/GECG01010065.1/~~gb/GECG01010065.1/.p1  ORF type:complete len:137 (+),score=12.14 gb/GECG01010065.1/:1-411(+)
MDGFLLFSAVSGSLVWHFPISVNYGLPYCPEELSRTTNGVQHKEELNLGSFLYAVQAYASDIFTESASELTITEEPSMRTVDLQGKRIVFFSYVATGESCLAPGLSKQITEWDQKLEGCHASVCMSASLILDPTSQ